MEGGLGATTFPPCLMDLLFYTASPRVPSPAVSRSVRALPSVSYKEDLPRTLVLNLLGWWWWVGGISGGHRSF